MRGWAFGVLGVVAGIGAGAAGTVALGGARHPEGREVVPAPRAPEVRCVTTLRESDVQYLRDQLIAAQAPVAEPPAPAVEAPPPPPLRASRVVEASQAAGRFTDADAAALRAELPSMSADEQETALKRLFAALNAGQIENHTTGPLFLD